MRVLDVSWVGVLTENYEETFHFFADVLGIALEFRDEAKILAHFRLPSGQFFELYGPSNRQQKEKYRLFDGPVLGLEVEDLRAARQEMIARGVKFITGVETDAPTGDAWSFFLGPEERLFTIQQNVRKYPEKNSRVTGFSWTGLTMLDFAGAVQFFAEVMEMPFARRDDAQAFAHFRLPSGHLFELFGPNNSWGRLTTQVTVAFEVDEVQSVRRELDQVGIEFVGDVVATSTGEEFTTFRGPDTYLYRIRKQG